MFVIIVVDKWELQQRPLYANRDKGQVLRFATRKEAERELAETPTGDGSRYARAWIVEDAE